MTKNTTHKRDNSAVTGILLMVLYGMLLGVVVGAELLSAADRSASLGGYLFDVCWSIVMLAAALYLQTLLHEGGHLVFGLLTGYRFVSFRIGSWMVQKENGRLRLHRFSLAGTGGQCLLAPPEMTDGKMPYKLYNLGGVLANLLTALLSAWLAVLCRDTWSVRLFFEMLCAAGLGSAVTNGVPLRVQGVANDGANARDMGKDPAALRSLWVQLSVNARQAEGVPLRDMPEEWFTPPDGKLDNIMTATQAVLYANRLMDGQQFVQTARVIDELEAQKTAILPLHQNLLLCDRLTCALLMGEDTGPWLGRWSSKEMCAFRKQMKNYPSVLRTEYGAALLVEKDRAKAEAFRSRFEVCAKKHPYVVEVESERALMHLLDEKARG